MLSTPIRSLLAAAFGLTGAHFWTKFISHLSESNRLSPRVARKLAHITTAPLFLLTYPLYPATTVSRYVACLVPLPFTLRILLNPTRDPLATAVARETGKSPTVQARGLACYAASASLLTAVGWRYDPATYVAVAAMAFGDGAADLVGSSVNGPVWGGSKLLWGRRKTVVGSLAFLASTLLGARGLLAFATRVGMLNRPVGFMHVLPVALAAASVELLPLEDNLTVPLCAFVVSKSMLRDLKH